ncbi:hypothetical protein BY996DRAFT_6490397 [Phakopsora pachyrhizi]|nr:hypothetical protein BY996DRAFT_6490397 [Phakopsora pachyrhizi]
MSSSTQSSFDPTLKLSSIPSKQIRHTDNEQLKSVETLYQLRSLRTSHLPSGNLKRLPKSLTDLSSDTEDSKYHLSGGIGRRNNSSFEWKDKKSKKKIRLTTEKQHIENKRSTKREGYRKEWANIVGSNRQGNEEDSATLEIGFKPPEAKVTEDSGRVSTVRLLLDTQTEDRTEKEQRLSRIKLQTAFGEWLQLQPAEENNEDHDYQNSWWENPQERINQLALLGILTASVVDVAFVSLDWMSFLSEVLYSTAFQPVRFGPRLCSISFNDNNGLIEDRGRLGIYTPRIYLIHFNSNSFILITTNNPNLNQGQALGTRSDSDPRFDVQIDLELWDTDLDESEKELGRWIESGDDQSHPRPWTELEKFWITHEGVWMWPMAVGDGATGLVAAFIDFPLKLTPSGDIVFYNVEHQIVYLTSQNHIPDQINCSSDRSHLQQTFHLSSNPLRMHNSSLSSASSSTDSWDFDPDLIIPDDSEKDTEDSTVSSSIESALISSNAALANQLSHSVNREHDLLQLGCFESEVEDEDEERGEETGRGGTLKLKIIKPQQQQANSISRVNVSAKKVKRSDGHHNSRYVDDPVCDLLQEPLALSSQLTKKGKPIKKPSGCCSSSSSSISKPNSLVSLIGSDSDFLEDKEQLDLKKCSSILSSSSSSSSSNQKRPTRLVFPFLETITSTMIPPTRLGQQQAHSQPHAEDDINKGFFDDIEFPPKFGIPNNLHPASTPSNPSSLPSSKLHKPIDQAQAGLDWDKDIVLPEEDEKDQKDQKAKSKEDIRTSRGKSKSTGSSSSKVQSSPPTFLNTNTGFITEHNEMEQDDNSNGNSGHNDDEDEEEDEEEDNDTNESETNPIDINMEASSIESNIITVNNPGIANSTQTVSNDQQANIAESEANSMLIPDTQEPQSMTGVQIPSQVETSNFLTCSNVSHQPTNSNVSGDPNNINSTLMVGRPDSNCTFFDSDSAINPAVTNSANTLIPKVPLCFECYSGKHLSFKNIILEYNFGYYGTSISQWLKHLDDVGCKANDNTIKDPAAGTFKNLDDFVDKIVHVLIAINMVQAHAKCQDNPAGPSSSIRPKRKGKASSSSIETVSSKTLQLVYREIGLERPLYCLLMAFCAAGVRGLMLGSNNWRKCGALESLQIITLSNEILKLKGNDFEEPYWPRASKYILQIIKSCFLPADPKSHKPMCPSRYEIAKCIVLDFGDTWHSKVDDSKKQHLSLPKKALVNAVISELS